MTKTQGENLNASPLAHNLYMTITAADRLTYRIEGQEATLDGRGATKIHSNSSGVTFGTFQTPEGPIEVLVSDVCPFVTKEDYETPDTVVYGRMGLFQLPTGAVNWDHSYTWFARVKSDPKNHNISGPVTAHYVKVSNTILGPVPKEHWGIVTRDTMVSTNDVVDNGLGWY